MSYLSVRQNIAVFIRDFHNTPFLRQVHAIMIDTFMGIYTTVTSTIFIHNLASENALQCLPVFRHKDFTCRHDQFQGIYRKIILFNISGKNNQRRAIATYSDRMIFHKRLIMSLHSNIIHFGTAALQITHDNPIEDILCCP